MERIPFNQPAIEGRELEYIREAVELGHTASSGRFSKLVSAVLREEVGSHEVLMTTSCTDALEMSALLLDLRPGDTVIVPSYTFVSTALAYAREGARVLFCDIEPETLAVDPAHVAHLMNDDVRAVVTVHYAGVAGDVAGLQAVLAQHPDVALVEDNAHGLFARYRGQPLGSFGRFSTLSFHETKNFLCGEGGALVLNDQDDVDRARVLYDKGTDRQAFLMGQVDKYSWKDIGSSFGLSDVLAAYLYAQLERREHIMSLRRGVYERYEAALAPVAASRGFRTPVVPADRDSGYHMYYVLLPDRTTRDRVLRHMNARGVQATFHYVPLHSSDGAKACVAKPTECPVTDDISGRLLRLPFFNGLTPSQGDRVVETFLTGLDTA